MSWPNTPAGYAGALLSAGGDESRLCITKTDIYVENRDTYPPLDLMSPAVVTSCLPFGTNSTRDLQLAIDAVSAAGGGVVRLAPGRQFSISKIAPKSNVLIDLNGSTLILRPNTAQPMFYDWQSGGVNFGIINGTLDCNQSAAGNNGANVLGGVWLSKWDGLRFDNLTIKNCPRIGLNLRGVRHVDVRGYRFIDSGVPGTGFFAYGFSFEQYAGVRSKHIRVSGVDCKNVYGFGAHVYQTDNFELSNLEFDTLTYNGLSIAITVTEAGRGSIRNVICNAVSGDNIEINDSFDVDVSNVTINAAGNRALLVGKNTVGNYNNRISVRNLSATNTGGAVSVVFSACADSLFERLRTDKGVSLDSSLPESLRNLVRDSVFNSGVASGLVGFGKFSMDRVEFLDWRIALFDRQRAIVTRGVEIKTGASFQINFSEIFPSLFDSEQVMAGSIRVVSVFRGSKNQGSMQTFSFLVNSLGTSATIGAVEKISNSMDRALTILADQSTGSISLTNGSGVDLDVSIRIDVQVQR